MRLSELVEERPNLVLPALTGGNFIKSSPLVLLAACSQVAEAPLGL